MTGPRSVARIAWGLQVVVPLLFGLYAVWRGQDANWDLRNYHIYGAVSLLEGRWRIDVAPGYGNSYHNPILYVPIYFALQHLPPRLTGMLLGTVQGLVFVPLFWIARTFMPRPRGVTGVLWSAALAALGLAGAGNLSEAGTSFCDNLAGLPVLGALLLWIRYVWRTHHVPAWALVTRAGVAGLLLGIAFGLKPTVGIYVVAVGAAGLVATAGFGRWLRLGASYGAGVLLGAVAAGGPWWLLLWHAYGNPFFPYLNNVFHSAYADLWHYRDLTFVPPDLGHAFWYPLYPALDSFRVSEVRFRDLRIPALALFGLVAGMRWGYLRLAHAASDVRIMPRHQRVWAFVCFACVGYAAWLWSFAIYRYLIPLEMVAPIGIWLALRYLVKPATTQRWVLLGAMALLVLTTKIPSWGRAPWGEDYLGIRLPPLPELEHSLIVLSGRWPLAYLAAALPPTVPILRLDQWGDPVRNPVFPGPPPHASAFDRDIRERLARHGGPIYLFVRNPDHATPGLAAYGLRVIPDSCAAFQPQLEPRPIQRCIVERKGPPR